MLAHLERQVERYSMNEKKVIAFIVEGPSDEAALGSVMKEYFSSNEVRFVAVHGDITLKDYVSADNILVKINEQIESVKNKYRYKQNDFIKIIHIVDTDGVYIPDTEIKEADVEEIQYYVDHIEAKNVSAIIERNERKGDILFKLRRTGKVNAEAYEGKVDEFIMFISDSAVAAPGTYQKTWDYIEKDTNSLNRHTNMHLIFDEK